MLFNAYLLNGFRVAGYGAFVYIDISSCYHNLAALMLIFIFLNTLLKYLVVDVLWYSVSQGYLTLSLSPYHQVGNPTGNRVELDQGHLTSSSTLHRGPIMGAPIHWYSTRMTNR